MHTSNRGYTTLPGTKVPACFKYLSIAAGSLTIKLNESPLPTSLRFKACVMMVMGKEDTGDGERTPTSVYINIGIMDKQNDLKDTCTPGYHFVRRLLTDHIYAFEFEAREVTSSELVFEFETYDRKWKIGKCGLFQILEVPSC